jgi:hypothetical protein
MQSISSCFLSAFIAFRRQGWLHIRMEPWSARSLVTASAHQQGMEYRLRRAIIILQPPPTTIIVRNAWRRSQVEIIIAFGWILALASQTGIGSSLPFSSQEFGYLSPFLSIWQAFAIRSTCLEWMELGLKMVSIPGGFSYLFNVQMFIIATPRCKFYIFLERYQLEVNVYLVRIC